MKLKKKSLLYWFIILILITYMVFIDKYSFFKRREMKRLMNLTQSELQILAEDNQRLKEENERLISDRSIWEKKARELGMKNPDDEIFKFKKTED